MEHDLIETEGKYSPAQTAEVRKSAIRQALKSQRQLFKSKDRINIRDTKALEERTMIYIDACESSGLVPNLEGLCACCGFNRQWLYHFLNDHPETESAHFINSLRLSWASLRMSLAESKVLDPASTIFVLKNSGLGFSDRQEIAIAPNDPMRDLDPEQARRRLIEAIPAEDDDI